MFGDDTQGDGNDDTSPWGFTPKRTPGRGNGSRSTVQTLLANADLPEIYVDTFDSLQTAGVVAVGQARVLLEDCGTSPTTQGRIFDLVTSRGEVQELGRGEFSVLLALVGLAQEGEEISLDSVDERRDKLPVPSLPSSLGAKGGKVQPLPVPPAGVAEEGAAKTGSAGAGYRGSSSFGDSDPWGSPVATMRAEAGAQSNGLASGGSGGGTAQRTTSTFTTAGDVGASDSTSAGAYGGTSQAVHDDGGWDTAGDNTLSKKALPSSADFLGDAGNDNDSPPAPRRAIPARTSKGAEEVVTVTLLEEKEGLFMFQHRNYEIASPRRGSKVIRRYSDFVWLLDCLHKRYPFRQLPLLPPKRVQINGNHLAADGGFMEKRRRGLARFVNAVVRHPVLREEQLCVMFLSVPTVRNPSSPYIGPPSTLPTLALKL